MAEVTAVFDLEGTSPTFRAVRRDDLQLLHILICSFEIDPRYSIGNDCYVITHASLLKLHGKSQGCDLLNRPQPPIVMRFRLFQFLQ